MSAHEGCILNNLILPYTFMDYISIPKGNAILGNSLR